MRDRTGAAVLQLGDDVVLETHVGQVRLVVRD
jgi:hypothetical protein